MSLLEQGETHVDVAVLTASKYDSQDEFNRDFAKAMRALGMPSLSNLEAELIRIDCVLRLAHDNADRLRDLRRELAEHGSSFFNMGEAESAPERLSDILETYWQLYIHSEDFFDLYVARERNPRAEAAALDAANSEMRKMRQLLRVRIPEFLSKLD
ncbi:MAG: hypothetical protein GC188_05420 [Alphaproteobacteria bacterium]|nr:hypothetical protein [Alphaproteobacteria bacterium]